MHARGEVAVGETLIMHSVIDSAFRATIAGATIAGATTLGEHPAVLPRIAGRAWIYGLFQVGLDPSDPYALGYTVADAWGAGRSLMPDCLNGWSARPPG
jgi:proline racemase